MRTKLTDYIAMNRLNETTVMHLLQQNGVVSDNCIEAKDVAPPDDETAVKWLEREKGNLL